MKLDKLKQYGQFLKCLKNNLYRSSKISISNYYNQIFAILNDLH
jgi:hypothetical protein